MHAIPPDRVRVEGERVILLSAIPKPWRPRTAKTSTSAEHPGTTVFWDERYFEVIDANRAGNGIRYTLEPWRDDHTFRTFARYDEASEEALRADHARALRQQKVSVASRFAGVILGHLPGPVQHQLQNELGVSPVRMTLLSCAGEAIAFGICLYISVGAFLRGVPSPVPGWLFILLAMLMADAGVRFYVTMSQGRGVGSIVGTPAYLLYLVVTRRPAAKEERSFFTIPPPDDVALRDTLVMRGPFLTLLPARDQQQLRDRYQFDYRAHAYPISWILLVFAILGIVTTPNRISIAAALYVAAEQCIRLVALRRGPIGSVFGIVVRPLAKSLLTARN